MSYFKLQHHIRAESRDELTRKRAEFNQSRWPLKVNWSKPMGLRSQKSDDTYFHQFARGETKLPCGQAYEDAQNEALACDYYIELGGEKEILFELWELDPQYVVDFPESGE